MSFPLIQKVSTASKGGVIFLLFRNFFLFVLCIFFLSKIFKLIVNIFSRINIFYDITKRFLAFCTKNNYLFHITYFINYLLHTFSV